MREATTCLTAATALLLGACSTDDLFISSPIEDPASLAVVYRPLRGAPKIRTSKPEEPIRLELADGPGRLFLAAYHQGRTAPDGTLVEDCTIELGGDGDPLLPNEVFSTAEFDPEQASVTWQPETELPPDIDLRTSDCQLEFNPCGPIQFSEILLPSENSYRSVTGTPEGIVYVGGKDESGQQPVLLRIEGGQTSTVSAPGENGGSIKALLSLSPSRLLGVTGFGGNLWELNPETGEHRGYAISEISSLTGSLDGDILIRATSQVFRFDSLELIPIPEAMPEGVNAFASARASYVVTADNFYRLLNGRLEIDLVPRVFADRLRLGGDRDVAVAVGGLQEILVRDLPGGLWRIESRPFEEFERLTTVTGASGGRFVIGGLSLLATYSDDVWCTQHVPNQDFRKLAQAERGVVYALAEEPARLIRIEFPPL